MPPSLLIVEDDGDVLEAMQGTLRKAGFTVASARSGKCALDAMRSGALPDLLLVDFELPDMNALELLQEKERWETSAKLAPVPALIVSGHDALAAELEAVSLPAVVSTLAKPFEPDELVLAVERCLDATRRPPPKREPDSADVLARALLQSQKAVRAREDLLAIVCHDLRVPLTTISMTTANMLSSTSADQRLADRQADLDRVLRAARQMRRLVRDLLDFSQLESGQLRVALTRQPLAALVGQAVELARAGLGSRRLSLAVADSARLLEVSCDRARLLQALGNLLANAGQYTPEGAGITVRVALDGGEAIIAVDDEGPGIAAQDLPTLFDPYLRGRSQRRAEDDGSLGLGLYISNGIARAHGGSLSAARREGGGTTMTLRLPCPPPSREVETPPILLVDDDDAIRFELCELLEHEGYRVVTASNGHAAWSYLKSHGPPALALLDLMMPVMDGWELLSALKRDPVLARMPTVIVSALDARRVEPSLIDICGYLEKPIKISALLQLVREHAGSPSAPLAVSR